MKSIAFEIPYPISVNKMYGTRKDGRRYLTKEARNYKDVVSKIMYYLSGNVKFDGDVKITIIDHASSRRHDKDNGLKIVFDSIQLSGIIKNDRQIKNYSLTEGEKRNPPTWIVTIESQEGIKNV